MWLARPRLSCRLRLWRPERRHWLAALAMLFVLFAPYQTLVQTVVTDDAVRKGVEADENQMVWVQVAYGVGVLYGVFTALTLAFRIGARYTIALGLAGFALGSLLCGAANSLESLAFGRFVEGFGKLLVMARGGPRSINTLTGCCSSPLASMESSPTPRGIALLCCWPNSTCISRGAGRSGFTFRWL